MNLTEQQAADELRFIKKVISDSRRNFFDNGMGYIVWGIIVFIGLVTEFIIRKNGITGFGYYFWAVLISGGWIWSFFYYFRKNRRSRATVFAGKIIGAVWFAAGFGMTLFGFVVYPSGAFQPVFISPSISIILGIAFFISGVIYDYKPIKYVSYGWWAGAVYMFYFPGLHSILVMAFMMLFFQVIPGIMLYQRSKKEIG